MRHVYGGLYIRPFILFNGEKTGYYVTEENGRQEKLTKANVLEAPVMPVYREKGRFGMINEMAVSIKLMRRAFLTPHRYILRMMRFRKSFLIPKLSGGNVYDDRFKR